MSASPDWVARKILMRHGLEPDTDVTFVPLLDRYPRIIEDMAEGGIDACMVMEPHLSIGEGD